MIIGISGYARSGKDTVADILVKDAGFERLAFADKLRECLYALNPVIGYENFELGLLRLVRLKDIIDEYGWDGVKSTLYAPEVRALLQRFGTEVGRNILGDNIWVEVAFNDVRHGKNYVFTDCRFVNEANAVGDVDGEVWRVTRPGVEPANDHISEIGLDNWPFNRIILNSGTIEDLREKVLSHVAYR